jgi:SP family sugar:H+ symporter-like MFS transporter
VYLGGKIGFIWGAVSMLTVVWVYFVVPELKVRKRDSDRAS